MMNCKRRVIETARPDVCLWLFLGSIEAPVPSSRSGVLRTPRAGRVKSAAYGGTGAPRSRRFDGEHGEDPRFVTAERGAMLRPGGRGAPISHGRIQAVAGSRQWR